MRYMIKFLNKEPQDFILSNNKPYSAKQMMAFAFKYFKLDFNDYIETTKSILEKKILRLEFQIIKRLMKKIRLNLDIRFMVKI